MVAFFYLSRQRETLVLFNSLDFGFFLVIVFTMYWIIGSKRRVAQNALILVASYVFYGFWDWRFLSLIIASSLIDYFAARYLHKSKGRVRRKFWLFFSLFWNLGILFTFKYMNFFLESFHMLFNSEILPGEFTVWNVIIPVGLSFYTFQTMSYTIDVYRKRIEPTTNLLSFLCFVSFFPQLVAGPIERAHFLLPQFAKNRSFDSSSAKEGLRQILWGLFKKILVADKLGIGVTMVFNEPELYGSAMLWYASLLFFFQLYCDFSGYTDIAIGTAKLFGFKLNKNFRVPYLSVSIHEFWGRWHITLTKWFTDYVYIPIIRSGNKGSIIRRNIAIIITMLLVGLWHGASWNFVAFGLINGLVLVFERIPVGRNGRSLQKTLYEIPRFLSLLYFLALAAFVSMFFRSESIAQSKLILERMFSFIPDDNLSLLIGFKMVFLAIMIIAEIHTKNMDFPLQNIERKISRPVRWVIYYTLVFLIIRFYAPLQSFIYFQF
jgi:D-alanyl-lipoteichoic acid acyltransferase DltB (MBOAT superfamily)